MLWHRIQNIKQAENTENTERRQLVFQKILYDTYNWNVENAELHKPVKIMTTQEYSETSLQRTPSGSQNSVRYRVVSVT